MNKEEFINWFIERNNTEYYEWFVKKHTNVDKANALVYEYFQKLEENKDKDFFEEALTILMKNKNRGVKVDAAMACVKYKINEKKAMRLIKRLAHSIRYRYSRPTLTAYGFLENLKMKKATSLKGDMND